MTVEEIEKEMNQPLDVKEGISKSILFSYIAVLLSRVKELESREMGSKKMIDFLVMRIDNVTKCNRHKREEKNET